MKILLYNYIAGVFLYTQSSLIGDVYKYWKSIKISDPMQIIFVWTNGNSPFPIHVYLKQLEMLCYHWNFWYVFNLCNLQLRMVALGTERCTVVNCEEDLSVLVDHREIAGPHDPAICCNGQKGQSCFGLHHWRCNVRITGSDTAILYGTEILGPVLLITIHKEW